MIGWGRLPGGKTFHAWEIEPGRDRVRSLCGKWYLLSKMSGEITARDYPKCRACSKVEASFGKWPRGIRT